MKGIWPIMEKDIRRLAWPWLGWLTVFVAVSVVAHGLRGGVLTGLSLALAGLVWTQLALGFVLAGAIVLEDPVAAPTAFWLTRPIARGRMLAAKVSTAFLLLIAMPMLVTAPVWLWNGRGGGQWGALGEFVMLPLLLPALAIAALSRDVGHFIVAGACVVIVHTSLSQPPLVQACARMVFGSAGPAHARIVEFPVWAVMGAILGLQYFTGRTRLGWGLLGGWLAGAFVVRVLGAAYGAR